MQNGLVKKIHKLNQVVLKSVKTKKEKDVIKDFTEVAIKILGADFGFSFFKEQDTGKFVLIHKNSKTPFNPPPPRGGGVTASAFRKKLPIYENDYTKSRWVINKISSHIKGCVSIPISYRNNNYGNFNICFKKKHKFTEEEKSLCVFIGSAASQAITINRLVDSEHKARLQSEHHQRRFRSLIENSYDAIMLIEPTGKIIYASPSVKRMSGYTPETLQGHNVSEFVHKEDMDLVGERIKDILKNTDKTFTIEFRYKNSSQEWGWMDATCVNMINNPSVGAIVANARDITRRKKAEEQEKVLIKQKEEFFSIASHELKTPVTVIKGFAQLLFHTLPPEQAEAKKFVSKINSNIDKVNRLIGDFLDVSVVQTGKLKFVNKRFEFNKFLQEKIEDLQLVVTDHDLSFSGKGEFWVEGDVERIAQVMNNLVTNAAKYSPAGTKIKVRLKDEGGIVMVEVEDFGMGIPEKYREKVFQRFFQAKEQQSANVYHGLGLGLYISSLIVRHHGGVLDFKSKPKGTIFYFTIPYNNGKRTTE